MYTLKGGFVHCKVESKLEFKLIWFEKVIDTLKDHPHLRWMILLYNINGCSGSIRPLPEGGPF